MAEIGALAPDNLVIWKPVTDNIGNNSFEYC